MYTTHTASTGLVKIQDLINDAKCFEVVRDLRWPEGVRCPHCADSEHPLASAGPERLRSTWHR
jgi:hypothetical protein